MSNINNDYYRLVQINHEIQDDTPIHECEALYNEATNITNKLLSKIGEKKRDDESDFHITD